MAKAHDDRFARWLDATVSNLGWSNRELAERVGVHESVVSRWLTGRSSPSTENLETLAGVLSVDFLALAVTAGLISERQGEPLPMPPPIAERARIKQQLDKVRGLGDAPAAAALRVWDAEHGIRP